MRFRSKRYKGEAEKAGKEALSLAEAVRKVKSFASTKFDQSVECVMHLGVDPKHADQMIRGAVSPMVSAKQGESSRFARILILRPPGRQAPLRQGVKN